MGRYHNPKRAYKTAYAPCPYCGIMKRMQNLSRHIRRECVPLFTDRKKKECK